MRPFTPPSLQLNTGKSLTFSFLSLAKTEAKLRETIVAVLKAAPYREGGSGKKSKTTVLPPFPTSVQEDVFEANDE